MKNDSACKKNIYCEFKPIIANDRVQVEICTKCSKKVIYHKDDSGRIDNAKYLRDHIRDTVQPFGRTRKEFLAIYGPGPIRDLEQRLYVKKSKAQNKKEWAEMKEDLMKRMSKTFL